MKRREFLRAFGCSLAVASLPVQRADAKKKEDEKKLTDIRKIRIEVGARRPFKALHVSDSHISRVDDRDNDRKKHLASVRGSYWPKAEYYYEASLEYAQKNRMLYLHTGDLIDFVSESNVDYMDDSLNDYGKLFMSSGNHEFSLYVGEAPEDEAYKMQSFDKIQNVCPNDLRMASFVYRGVNFIALDDVYYNFTETQRLWMEKQVERGLPIVMMCHIPLYTPKHSERNLKKNGWTDHLVGAPQEMLDKHSGLHKPNRETREFVDWLKKQSQVKAILSGHIHDFFEEQFSDSAVQYVVGAGFEGSAYEIEFV